MAKPDATEVANALREAGASHLWPEGASYLKRRLSLGACFDQERARYNIGALKNLRFGHTERKSLSIGEAPMSGEVIAEHQKAYRRGVTSWIPSGAIPKDSSERVRLFEERRAHLMQIVLGGEATPNLSDDDLLGVGLASYTTLEKAAQELVRAAYRAAPRGWSKVGDAELKALDSYPTLRRVAIPAAPELSAPLGWVPGVGPSEESEETFRKLSADWEAFENVVPEVSPEDATAWRSLRDAWSAGTLLPTELGDRLVEEVARAQRIRASLMGKGVASPAATPGEASFAEPEEGGVRGFLAKVATKEMVVAGGFLIAVVTLLFGSSASSSSSDEDTLGGGHPRPRLPPHVEHGSGESASDSDSGSSSEMGSASGSSD